MAATNPREPINYETCPNSNCRFSWPENTTEAMELPTTDPSSIEDIEIEKRIYKRLGSHPNIVSCLRIAETGPVSVCAEHIVLKRAEYGTIRQYFLDRGTSTKAV
ncbi:hypothetical protein BDV96DRAFT_655820 [Lophiotrema nucula]|uniref:Protein kinase domain-containing protein n=1 Tax=Lophiotrema nucula TaxID=690887 RepID=A0A6A5YDV3_9PLEO|nr:hypothetical protein BDV96DRAFT_655820 [Lophiotrema nucula]